MIVDYDYEISLSEEEKEKVITTDMIIGKLKALIISASKPCEVLICFSELNDIVLFEDINYSGTNYIPLKAEVFNGRRERYNYQSDDFMLNNALLIRIRGSSLTKAIITLRCENGA